LVADLTLAAYKSVSQFYWSGALKVGNTGIYTLSRIGTNDAVGQLAVLKGSVRLGTAQREIEKAFVRAAEALQMPREEIEEMGVPTYGLSQDGRYEESVGDYRAEIVVEGTDAALAWYDAAGKALKAAPAKVRREHADELRQLRQLLKDVKAMMPAQRDRIDSSYLARRTWPFHVWRERYCDHPLVGAIARKLIWCVDGEPALFVSGAAETVTGEQLSHGATAEISLWHPVGRPIEQILAWRERLEKLGITQPFKQAHREVYLLTAAEETTGTYSNRFAAHIVRQHQFNALCGVRGWKNQLRLNVDDSRPPPVKHLREWGLRAEFWVEGAGEETTPSGSFLYLATDQVRFHRIGAAGNTAHTLGGGYFADAGGPGRENFNDPLPLNEIPALAFSEIMRDVDLFVGVSSVGNDPNWQDGGPEGRYRNYWHTYSFGELSESAATRRAVLEKLVPRLKIAKQCSLVDRYLVVEGKVRTYKIHLGSGNILMEPNDEYLCVVPDAKAKLGGSDLYLPFEGDGILSIILSKALLLAADDKIKDRTILLQIHRR
ncbi:MAG: DUF4132 domain-containing protein, partial [Planctomycetales bacterium]|nr:DUF4132 domain-containing protein [Planctomycetales bacterium]